MMILYVLIFALAANAADVPADSLAKMQAAIEKQRASVRRQAPGPAASFFTTGWVAAQMPEPLAAVSAPCEAVGGEELRKIVVESATKEGVSPVLLRAVIGRESGGRPCAVSHKGAEGLMQLMPGTAAELGVQDPFDPLQNVLGGTRYLRQMLDRYKGDVRLALAAYNAGPQRVDDAKGVPAIAETQAYVNAILSDLKSLEAPIE